MSFAGVYGIREEIPLGRRIGEILEEKGDAFSLRAFSKRIGMGKDTLSRCVNGGRFIRPSELDKISAALHVPVKRITKEDNKQTAEQLAKLLTDFSDPHRAVKLARQLCSVALGMSERSLTLNDLGRAYFALRMYEEAHEAWLEAYRYSKQMSEKYDDAETLYQVIANLSVSFSVRKKLLDLVHFLYEAKQLLENSPRYSGHIYYSLATLAHQLGDAEEARDALSKSLAFFEQTGNHRSIGKAKHTLACLEYELKNYQIAKGLFEDAFAKLSCYRDVKYIVIKDFSKTLLKLGEREKVVDLISGSFEELKLMDDSELRGKMLLILAYAQNDARSAEAILEDVGLTDSLRKLTNRFLMKHYKNKGDSGMFMKYAEITYASIDEDSDILDEEEL